MSPAVAARFPWYIKIFHGRQGARSLHFLPPCAFIVFFIGHVTIVALHGFRRQLALIILCQTHNPHLTLALVVWLAGLTGIAAIHVVTTVCSRRRPRFVQKATQSITDPVRTLLFAYEISAQQYSPADISPYFWVNGRPSTEEHYLAMARIDDEEPELAREYLLKYDYTLPTLVDRKDQVVNLFHRNGWPTTVLIDREGLRFNVTCEPCSHFPRCRLTSQRGGITFPPLISPKASRHDR